MYRDLGYYWLRLAIYIALAVGLGTVFFNIGHSYGSIQVSHHEDKKSDQTSKTLFHCFKLTLFVWIYMEHVAFDCFRQEFR